MDGLQTSPGDLTKARLHSRVTLFRDVFVFGRTHRLFARRDYNLNNLLPSMLVLFSRALTPIQLLLEPNAVLRPGGCYTVRGSALAVHIVVDPKHRVYACITVQDVPFSLGLSLLEEVRSTSLKPLPQQLLG